MHAKPVDAGALRALLSLLAAPEVGCVTGNLVLDGTEGSGVLSGGYENWDSRSRNPALAVSWG